jgi:hypothetical protein
VSLRPASPVEWDAWNQWLEASHGLRGLAGAVVYHCQVDFPMLLTPWRKFEDFTMRLERENGQPVMTFRLAGNVRTVAEFWSIPGSARTPFTRRHHLDTLTRRLFDSAIEGRVWWGVEYPVESAATTIFIRWFPRGFVPPSTLKAGLKTEPPAPSGESSVDLV